jgi:hypothetical protein
MATLNKIPNTNHLFFFLLNKVLTSFRLSLSVFSNTSSRSLSIFVNLLVIKYIDNIDNSEVNSKNILINALTAENA